MITSISKYIKQNILRNTTVILAFSGGPDSVYLFYQIKKVQKLHPFTVILAHFNHNLRGKDSIKDEQFCKRFANKNKVIIEIGSANIKNKKGNTEDIARKYRYKFLNKVKEKYDAEFIVTAHHLDDNIETFLMNFMRGTGLKGLSAMQVKSLNILRPLLGVSKKEILSYLKKYSIRFCIDKTNFDESYTRNNVRKNIIPLLRKIQPSFDKIFLRNWKTMSQTQKFIDKNAETWIKKNMKKKYEINLKKFNNTEQFLQTLIIRKLFYLYHKTTDNLSKNTVLRAQKIINEEKTGKKTPFGQKTILIINSNSFEIRNTNKIKKILLKKLQIPGETQYIHGKILLKILNKVPKELSNGIFLDYLKCKFPLYIRGKKNGDTFKNIGMRGRQKLQDFFVNKKIPSQKRDTIPIIIDKTNNIIAIGNEAISDSCKITRHTKQIISISFKPPLENKQK
ncbi:tRNA lysidine(34) synthetase TilS [bacterium]|nr:tRNA lysidine(34) synthetase TilS [bacterium]